LPRRRPHAPPRPQSSVLNPLSSRPRSRRRPRAVHPITVRAQPPPPQRPADVIANPLPAAAGDPSPGSRCCRTCCCGAPYPGSCCRRSSISELPQLSALLLFDFCHVLPGSISRLMRSIPKICPSTAPNPNPIPRHRVPDPIPYSLPWSHSLRQLRPSLPCTSGWREWALLERTTCGCYIFSLIHGINGVSA
uniref:Uncharacterized protein n=1 Tax=Triticum urartu TaxID=4572 RepID=A0A8R7R5V6_TRIUA